MIWTAGKVEALVIFLLMLIQGLLPALILYLSRDVIDAEILILDEPTAALDAESEHALFQRFKMLTQDVTTLLISHRFSTVRMADKILVIDDGKIIEEGTHKQLIEKDGRYATLYQMQSEKYQ